MVCRLLYAILEEDFLIQSVELCTNILSTKEKRLFNKDIKAAGKKPTGAEEEKKKYKEIPGKVDLLVQQGVGHPCA